MQEEIENRTVNLAISTTRLTANTLIAGFKKYMQHRANVKAKAAAKADEKPVGKQTIQELIGQNQGVSSIDIAKTDIRGFEKYARRYGVDYAIVKDKTGEVPKYVCFFKARDADALTSAFNAYTADVLKSKERPSVLKQLSKLKEIVAALPAKVLQRQKERVQDR